MRASDRLNALGLILPPAPKPVGSYLPAVRSANLVFVSGQLPLREGKVQYAGKVPTDVQLSDAAQAARMAVLNALAIAADVAGGIDQLQRIVRLGVFVNSATGFTEQPKVANGASDLLVEIFGDAGRHARAAVGVNELPLNAAVEVELIAEIMA